MCGMCVCVCVCGGGAEGASFGAEILYPSFFGHAYAIDVKPISHKCCLVKKIALRKTAFLAVSAVPLIPM